MKKLISFSGPQSSGKSTLLRAMELHYGDNFVYVPEITRQIREQFKVAINEDGNDFTQSLIINKHIENYLLYLNQDKTTVLDRCILDGLIYTDWLHQENRVSTYVYNFAISTYFKLIDKLDVIFYTDPCDVPLVDDGERSTNVQFRQTIADSFEKYLPGLSNVVRLQGSVIDRMNQIKQYI